MIIKSLSAEEIIGLEKAKSFLKITTDSEDHIVMLLIDAVIDIAERATWRSLREKTIEEIFTDEPEWVVLAQTPVASIDKFEYLGAGGWVEVADFQAYNPNGYIYTGSYKTVRITYTTGVWYNADVYALLYDLLAAKYDSRPEDPKQMQDIIKRFEMYKRWVVK